MVRLKRVNGILFLALATVVVAGGSAAHASFERGNLPALTATGTRVIEGDSGTTDAVFTLHLSHASPQVVSVHVVTEDGSASSGSDYIARSGTVRFRPGQRSTLVRVKVRGDTQPETAETFSLALSRAKGAWLRNHSATATIPENDLPPPFTLQASANGAGEIDDPPSPNGRGSATLLLDAAKKQVTYTLTITGMTLGDSGLCSGPAGQHYQLVIRFGDPTGPNTVTGTRHLDLNHIIAMYLAPASYCVRATTPTRSEFIRGQLSRT